MTTVDWHTCRICKDIFATENLVTEKSEPCCTCGERKVVYVHTRCLGKEVAEKSLGEIKKGGLR